MKLLLEATLKGMSFECTTGGRIWGFTVRMLVCCALLLTDKSWQDDRDLMLCDNIVDSPCLRTHTDRTSQMMVVDAHPAMTSMNLPVGWDGRPLRTPGVCVLSSLHASGRNRIAAWKRTNSSNPEQVKHLPPPPMSYEEWWRRKNESSELQSDAGSRNTLSRAGNHQSK